MSEGKKFDVMAWLKESKGGERYERISYLLIFAAVAMVMAGILLGSFVRYTVYVAAAGALLLLPGIVLYIASQLMERRNETVPA